LRLAAVLTTDGVFPDLSGAAALAGGSAAGVADEEASVREASGGGGGGNTRYQPITMKTERTRNKMKRFWLSKKILPLN
jgi:hypothetical protein